MLGTIQLISQIDIVHWTVQFMDGEWKGKIGDYRIEDQNLEAGQHVLAEVTQWPKHKEPSTNGYCGEIVVKSVVEDKKAKKK